MAGSIIEPRAAGVVYEVAVIVVATVIVFGVGLEVLYSLIRWVLAITESECDNVVVVVVVVIAVVEGLMTERGKVVNAVVTGVVGVLHLWSHFRGAVVLDFLLEFYLFFCDLGFDLGFCCAGRLGG